MRRAAVVMISCWLAAAPAAAQAGAGSDVWVDVGLGIGRRACEACMGAGFGPVAVAAAGWSFSPQVRIGMAVGAWMGEVHRQSRYGTSSGTDLLLTLMPLARVHPAGAPGLFLAVGAGASLGTGTFLGLPEAGTAASLEVGWDVTVGRHRVAPFVQGLRVYADGSSSSLVQVGAKAAIR